MASLPPVKLDTHEDWFNLLMTVLHQQAEQNPYEEYREMAQKLIDQFMRCCSPCAINMTLIRITAQN